MVSFFLLIYYIHIYIYFFTNMSYRHLVVKSLFFFSFLFFIFISPKHTVKAFDDYRVICFLIFYATNINMLYFPPLFLISMIMQHTIYMQGFSILFQYYYWYFYPRIRFRTALFYCITYTAVFLFQNHFFCVCLYKNASRIKKLIYEGFHPNWAQVGLKSCRNRSKFRHSHTNCIVS